MTLHFYQDGWFVSGYYAEDVKPPKKPHELALKVWCGSEHVRDMEVEIFKNRSDIGDVIVEVAKKNV